MEKSDDEQGKKLLTAVERILVSNESIRATVTSVQAGIKSKFPELKGPELRAAVGHELVRDYSNRAAIAGAGSGLPALIPGWGSLVAAVGGTFAELTLLLKWEVEMALCLSHLYGFDIEEPRERQLAFLMASVGTYDATGKNFFADIARLEGTAIWNYGPRRVARFVVQAMALVAAMYLWRGLLKAVPVVGMVVGGGMNKLLTKRVGDRCMRDLETRRDLERDAEKSSAPRKPKLKKKKAAPREPPAEETIN